MEYANEMQHILWMQFHDTVFVSLKTNYDRFFFLVSALQNDDVLLRRARHVITEIQRTREAAEALRKQDFKEVCL